MRPLPLRRRVPAQRLPSAAALFEGERILTSDLAVDREGRLVECVVTDRGLHALHPERLTSFRYSAWTELTCTSTTVAFAVRGPAFYFFDFRGGERRHVPLVVQKQAVRWMSAAARRRVHLLGRARLVRAGRTRPVDGVLDVRGDEPSFRQDDGALLPLAWSDVACYRYTLEGFRLALTDGSDLEVSVPVGDLELWTPVLAAHLEGAAATRVL